MYNLPGIKIGIVSLEGVSIKINALIGVVTALGLGPLAVAQAQQVTKTASVTGRVFRSDTKRTFAGAAVRLELAGKDIPEEKKVVAEVKTDAKGNYSFARVAPGAYLLAAVVVFQSDGESPCKVESIGLNLFPESNAYGWSVHMMRTNVGVIESISSKEFSVSVGRNVQKDIDLKCK
jgi:hypothetical protein